MTPDPPRPADQSSAGFDRLHPRIQRWIWEQKWTELRDAQEQAIAPVLAGDTDLIISAATAAGKTEAAFLPICSALFADRDPISGYARTLPATTPTEQAPPAPQGVKVLYVSPLKALINDQYGRLDALCEHLDIPVHRWHGDVAGSRKVKVLDHPDGILLITPESLEALLVVHGPKIRSIAGGLRYVVIDEMHSFLGSERGAQLQSLLHRVEVAIRRRIPRIGLSATLGDMAAAADYLRPGRGEHVSVITSTDDTNELRLQLRGYEALPAKLTPRLAEQAEAAGQDVDAEDVTTGDRLAIAQHLFTTLRGTDNLIFANARREVEIYTDLLNRQCEREHVPTEFVPHHGSLSRELREHAEARLKDRFTPVSAVCTSTLEMGIDIGSVTSIAQIGSPHTVASLRQRLGRSGRRGEPATMRLYISEEQITPDTPVSDALRTELVQSIAMVNLLLNRWNEAPDVAGLHLSTLVQQVLSLIAQYGGVTPLEAYRTLCEQGPFARVTQDMFKSLLRALARESIDLLMQSSDGLLLLGVKGERIVNHYSFYAAFRSGEEYRLVASGRTLGTLPVDSPLMPGDLLIFAGRRWKILAVDDHSRVIELERSSGGRAPRFSGSGGEVADEVRREMRRIYLSSDVPAYLDRHAVRLLAEGRDNSTRFRLHQDPLLVSGTDTLIFPWRGDRILTTLNAALTAAGITTAHDGICLTFTNADRPQAIDHLTALLDGGPPDPIELADKMAAKIVEKYDGMLTDDLLNQACAARSLDVPNAWGALSELLNDVRAAVSRVGAQPTAGAEFVVPPVHTHIDLPVPVPVAPTETAPPTASGSRRRPPHRPELGTTPFAVIDVETTGLFPRRHDRVVEIAIVRTAPDGTIEDSWSTLLNPQRDLGPTHIHGIRGVDVLDAPRFLDVAGDIADRLEGAVVVAHNARFDLGFLTAEYTRLGARPPTWPALCTLDLSYRYGSLGGGRLGDCIAAEGFTHNAQHTALGDATAAANLLSSYLRTATADGVHDFDDLGCAPNGWPDAEDWSNWPLSRLSHTRAARRRPDASPLAQLIRRLPAHDLTAVDASDDVGAYLDLLDRALEDRRLDPDEIQALTETAYEWGLTRRDLHLAHTTYLHALAATALADGVVTELEQEDLNTVAETLGFGIGEIAAALQAARDRAPMTDNPASPSLRGLGVCFTGSLMTLVHGQPMTRELAEHLARSAGMVVHNSVTRSLDILIVADPNTQSGKAIKARKYGTRIIAEAVFWRTLGVGFV